MVLNFVIFWLCIYFTRLTPPTAKIMIPLGISVAALAALPFMGEATGRLFARFQNIGSAGFNTLSSGRGYHWERAIELWTSDPMTMLFGVGNRMGGQLLGHAVENFVLFHLLDFGMLGAALFFAFLGVTLRPIASYSLRKNRAAQGMFVLWLAVLSQWMFNDLNTFYQTFPALMLLTVWCGAWLQAGAHQDAQAAPQRPMPRWRRVRVRL